MFNQSEDRRRVLAWQMYDWANSSFATVMIAAVLPVYFGLVFQLHFPLGVSVGGVQLQSTAIWGMANALSMIMVATVALVLGPMADRMARKKPALATFAAIGVIASGLMGFVPMNLWWMLAMLYALSNMGFAGGNIFYDALLPAVAPRAQLDRTSSGGYALGYVGGGLLLAICVGLIFFMPQQTVSGVDGIAQQKPVAAMRISFTLVAVWWALFSIPLFKVVPEPPAHASQGGATPIRPVRETLRDLLRHKELLKYLLAFWFFSDGVGTIIKMAAVYGTEIFSVGGRDVSHHLIGTLLLVQFAGVPFTLLWPKIASRIGTKQAILLCLTVYAGICVLGFYMSQIWHFYALGFAVALVQGGTQALSRSLFARLVPEGREAEFFGFYNISGKFAGILGPALFAILAAFGGTSRETILALIAFFIIGGAVLASVRIPPEPDK